jgi:hypothetical protein
MFEKFICKRLSDFLNSNSTLAVEQFVFKMNILVVVAVFCFKHGLLGALNNKIYVRGMSCIFAKAFDCVDDEILHQTNFMWNLRDSWTVVLIISL